MRTMPNPTTKKDDDWLSGLIPNNESSNNNNNNNNNSRKKSSDFSLDDLIKPRDSSANKGNTSNSKNANSGSDLDWLGFKDSSKDSIDVTTNKQQRLNQQENPVLEKPPLHTNIHNNQTTPRAGMGLNTAKDSMNSSFADSVDLHDNRAQLARNENTESKADLNVNSMNGEEDGWLNNLMNKKGGVKKVGSFIFETHVQRVLSKIFYPDVGNS